MPSPMQAVNVAAETYSTPPERLAVEVYVDTTDEPGWYYGELREWTKYQEIGWTGWVQYSLQGRNYSGRFLQEHIRPAQAASSGSTAM